MSLCFLFLFVFCLVLFLTGLKNRTSFHFVDKYENIWMSVVGTLCANAHCRASLILDSKVAWFISETTLLSN